MPLCSGVTPIHPVKPNFQIWIFIFYFFNWGPIWVHMWSQEIKQLPLKRPVPFLPQHVFTSNSECMWEHAHSNWGIKLAKPSFVCEMKIQSVIPVAHHNQQTVTTISYYRFTGMLRNQIHKALQSLEICSWQPSERMDVEMSFPLSHVIAAFTVTLLKVAFQRWSFWCDGAQRRGCGRLLWLVLFSWLAVPPPSTTSHTVIQMEWEISLPQVKAL